MIESLIKQVNFVLNQGLSTERDNHTCHSCKTIITVNIDPQRQKQHIYLTLCFMFWYLLSVGSYALFKWSFKITCM